MVPGQERFWLGYVYNFKCLVQFDVADGQAKRPRLPLANQQAELLHAHRVKRRRIGDSPPAPAWLQTPQRNYDLLPDTRRTDESGLIADTIKLRVHASRKFVAPAVAAHHKAIGLASDARHREDGRSDRGKATLIGQRDLAGENRPAVGIMAEPAG